MRAGCYKDDNNSNKYDRGATVILRLFSPNRSHLPRKFLHIEIISLLGAARCNLADTVVILTKIVVRNVYGMKLQATSRFPVLLRTEHSSFHTRFPPPTIVDQDVQWQDLDLLWQ